MPRKAALNLDPATMGKLLARLHRVEGQVRAISRQTGAAKSAPERATVQLMPASFIEHLRPNDRGEPDRRELTRLADTFMKVLG